MANLVGLVATVIAASEAAAVPAPAYDVCVLVLNSRTRRHLSAISWRLFPGETAPDEGTVARRVNHGAKMIVLQATWYSYMRDSFFLDNVDVVLALFFCGSYSVRSSTRRLTRLIYHT